MTKAYTTIIDVDVLAENVANPDWRVMDCRFDLMNKPAGRQYYVQAHIPNALYAHLEEDLSGPLTNTSGRHPLPDASSLAEKFCRWGIGENTQLIVYDAQAGALASRLWWLSRWLGHQKVAVLNGGFSAWLAAGLPTETAIPDIVTTNFKASPDDSLWVSSDTVQQQLDDDNSLLIDARDERRFRGELEPLDKRAGNIPGSVNYPFEWNLDADGKFLAPEKLQARFSQTVTNITGKKIIHSCGSGVTACHNILAMEIMGLPGSLLYPGSWSEWITDSNRPVSGEKES